jgi:hypothetical protein
MIRTWVKKAVICRNWGALIDCRYNGHANFNQRTCIAHTQSCSLTVLNLLCFISRMRLPPYLPQRRDYRAGIYDCQPPLRATLGHVCVSEHKEDQLMADHSSPTILNRLDSGISGSDTALSMTVFILCSSVARGIKESRQIQWVRDWTTPSVCHSTSSDTYMKSGWHLMANLPKNEDVKDAEQLYLLWIVTSHGHWNLEMWEPRPLTTLGTSTACIGITLPLYSSCRAVTNKLFRTL